MKNPKMPEMAQFETPALWAEAVALWAAASALSAASAAASAEAEITKTKTIEIHCNMMNEIVGASSLHKFVRFNEETKMWEVKTRTSNPTSTTTDRANPIPSAHKGCVYSKDNGLTFFAYTALAGGGVNSKEATRLLKKEGIKTLLKKSPEGDIEIITL